MLATLLLAFLPQGQAIEPMPSEVMPAESIPVTDRGPMPEVPPVIPRGPWVTPGEAGSKSPYAIWQNNTWGWNIPAEQPRTGNDKSLGASNNSVINTHYSGPGGPVVWTESRFYGTPADIGQDVKTKWGWVVFDFYDASFEYCTWDTIAIEHGQYITGWAPMTWYGCSWENINGQGIQHVYSHPDSKRAAQTGLPKNTWLRLAQALAGETLEVRRCETKQVGIPPLSERASFTFSFFSPNGKDGPAWNPVTITESYMQTHYEWTDANGVTRDCAGAIMAHRRPHVEITRNCILYAKGDRDVIQVWGCSDGIAGTPDVVLSENFIWAAKAIDIRLQHPSDTVIIARNRGNAEVVISMNDWYVWESNGWKERAVLYRGQISQNYRLN